MGSGLEPVYVDEGDEFDDNSWKYPNTDFEKTVLNAAGHRKYYYKEIQAKRVRAIEAHPDKYPEAYVRQVLDWCRKMNRTRTVIGLDTLINVIRNPDNLARYLRHEPEAEDRSGYTDYQGW
jgi:hypothetical protein